MAYDDSDTYLGPNHPIETVAGTSDLSAEKSSERPRAGVILGIGVGVIAVIGLLIGYSLGRATNPNHQ